MSDRDWFETLFGFKENINDVYNNLEVTDNIMKSKINNKSYIVGHFEVVSVDTLLRRKTNDTHTHKPSYIQAITADVSELLATVENGCVFQVASQFNCLEFMNPYKTPEDGVTNYMFDKTQGPACSLSCGPATVYRNYFHKMPNGHIGQTFDNQINCFEDIEKTLNISVINNGYLTCSVTDLDNINTKTEQLDSTSLGRKLKIGIQHNTQVTSKHWGNIVLEEEKTVTQVFASSAAIRYSPYTMNCLEKWESLSRMILENTYIAAFHTAYLSDKKTLFLTMVGGGVFGNPLDWILDAIKKAYIMYSQHGITVYIVCYRYIPDEIYDFITNINVK